MANIIPRADGAIRPPEWEFQTIQKLATTMASEANWLSQNLAIAPVRRVTEFRDQCVAVGQRLSSMKANVLLQNYAKSIHPDGALYDIDVAIDVCIAAYISYRNWYDNTLKPDAANRLNIETRTINITDGAAVLASIVATVE